MSSLLPPTKSSHLQPIFFSFNAMPLTLYMPLVPPSSRPAHLHIAQFRRPGSFLSAGSCGEGRIIFQARFTAPVEPRLPQSALRVCGEDCGRQIAISHGSAVTVRGWVGSGKLRTGYAMMIELVPSTFGCVSHSNS